jgi:hypothetical protein
MTRPISGISEAIVVDGATDVAVGTADVAVGTTVASPDVAVGAELCGECSAAADDHSKLVPVRGGNDPVETDVGVDPGEQAVSAAARRAAPTSRWVISSPRLPVSRLARLR